MEAKTASGIVSTHQDGKRARTPSRNATSLASCYSNMARPEFREHQKPLHGCSVEFSPVIASVVHPPTKRFHVNDIHMVRTTFVLLNIHAWYEVASQCVIG